MTYYFARLSSPDGLKSSPVLISRNESKVKIDIGDLKLEWDGIFPIPQYNTPKEWLSFESKSTKIDKPANLLKTWENSTIELQGGSMRDFIDVSLEKDVLSGWGLMALNISVMPTLLADLMVNGKNDIKGEDLIGRVTDVADKIKNFHKGVEDLNYYYTWLEAGLDITQSIVDTFALEGSPLPASIVDAKNYFQYVKTLMGNIEKISGSLQVNYKIKDELKTEFAIQLKASLLQTEKTKEYNKIFDYDEIGKSESDKLIALVAKTYKNSDSDNNKLVFLADTLLDSINRTLAAYEKRALKRMPMSTPPTPAELQAKSDKRLRIQKVKFGVVAAIAVKGLFFAKDGEEFADNAMKLLTDAGGMALQMIWDRNVSSVASFLANSASENASKYADNLVADSAKQFARVGKSFQIGYVAGNKVLPFLYDFAFAGNFISANIIDKKVSMYGDLEKRIEIYKQVGSNYEQVWTSEEASLVNGGDVLIDVAKDDILQYRIFSKQKDLFDNPERSPWEINTFINPQPVFFCFT